MMKQLNKIQSALFLLGGMLMVAGAGCYVMMWQQGTVCWIFLVGAVMFSLMQAMQAYTGDDITLRRLKGIQGIAGLLFVVSGVLVAALLEVYTTHRISHEISKKHIKE